MSAGPFGSFVYKMDSGTNITITMQFETAAFASGTAVNILPAAEVAATGWPTGTVTSSRRGRGKIYCRMITIKPVGLTATDVPSGYAANAPLRIPIVSKTLFDSITKTSALTYLGKAYKLVGKTGERVS